MLISYINDLIFLFNAKKNNKINIKVAIFLFKKQKRPLESNVYIFKIIYELFGDKFEIKVRFLLQSTHTHTHTRTLTAYLHACPRMPPSPLLLLLLRVKAPLDRGKMSATASPDHIIPHHPREAEEDPALTAAPPPAAAASRKSRLTYGHMQEVSLRQLGAEPPWRINRTEKMVVGLLNTPPSPPPPPPPHASSSLSLALTGACRFGKRQGGSTKKKRSFSTLELIYFNGKVSRARAADPPAADFGVVRGAH